MENVQSSYPESRVLIIMTGGTVCMRPSLNGDGLVPMTGFLKNAMAPRPTFNDYSGSVKLDAMQDSKLTSIESLRTPITTYSRHIRYGMIEFSPLLDSSSISAHGWTHIARAIKENYHLFDGFVVLHGTDSLSYTASALSFMMSDLGKPVILTGSQASIFALQTDAVDNLLGSLIIAGTFVIPEVCLFFHHTLFRGNRTTKVSASKFEAFGSPNCDPLAKVTSIGIDVNWALVRRPTRIAEFAVTEYLDTAHVACLGIFPGIKPEMVNSVLRLPNLEGLILETFGMGNAPGGVDGALTKVIADGCARGIVIVNVSQCVNGIVSPLYAPGTALERAGVVFGYDLTTEAALTKLSWLLAVPGLSRAEVANKMSHSLCGEMTELEQPTFSHPADNSAAAIARLNCADTAFTALGYAIKCGDVKGVRQLLEGDEFVHQLLKRCDYSGNTAIHLAAVGPAEEVLRELLTRGASVHARNSCDNTALFLAEKMGMEAHVRLLREAGGHLWEKEKDMVDVAVGRKGLSSEGPEGAVVGAVEEDEKPVVLN